LFAKTFRAGKHGHDVARAHARGEVEGGEVFGNFLVESLSGLGGVEDEQAAVGSVLSDVGDELCIIE
jgi:hypothetical protein